MGKCTSTNDVPYKKLMPSFQRHLYSLCIFLSVTNPPAIHPLFILLPMCLAVCLSIYLSLCHLSPSLSLL